MVDNAEWSTGVTATRLGIQHVNYTSLERHFKRSSLALCESLSFICSAVLRAKCCLLAAEFYDAHKT